MRKKVRKSFKQLLTENKQSLLSNKENMKEIEERIEKRHVAYSCSNN
ncbi:MULTISPECIES: FbpB family small basic protein [Bacillus cereus group]|uniref:FbpB family small basic protein n=1 Tax=Bacillus cereus TaxID=1396 RepID=A0A2C0EYW8_BACCE|nr:FbpB family small basic protein [Bacillus cereus]PDY81075.1 FbpB family small basic protein [Bacillus cereus]PFA15275.1 FbpB family small basic protein [Bacillus cereus]PFM43001.1 FbpB family small basic protein [Bacillus cereus]PGL65360.1 FbpB family small basic protein [Bacillus cereus]PGQ11137.1 FbpB family small basic protein [Bacillus cereus]